MHEYLAIACRVERFQQLAVRKSTVPSQKQVPGHEGESSERHQQVVAGSCVDAQHRRHLATCLHLKLRHAICEESQLALRTANVTCMHR